MRKQNKNSIPSSEAGATLIEVLLAIAVLSIGLFLIGMGAFSTINTITKVNTKINNNVLLLEVTNLVGMYVGRVSFPYWAKPEVTTGPGGRSFSINYLDGDPDKEFFIEFEDSVLRIGEEEAFQELRGFSEISISIDDDTLENLGMSVTIEDYTSKGLIFSFNYGSIP